MVNKRDLKTSVAARAGQQTVICGLLDGKIQKYWGGEYIYIDHAYFQRGWDKNHFRMVRNAPHLTRIIANKTDRLEKFKVELKPYRKNGGHIVLIVPGDYAAKAYKEEGMADRMLIECQKHTDRKIVVKTKGSNLMEHLVNAWAAISPFSVGGVEAAVAGIPVFSSPLCPSWPVSAGKLSDIESPVLHDRYEWANSLAWSTWHIDELKTINLKEYQCAS